MAEEKIITVRDINYIVASDGKIYSANNCGATKYHKEISQRPNADGYMQITVGKTRDRRTCSVHRMVAEAFVPNPNNFPEVNHKDNNRSNNNADNLEWCTHAYNVQYAINSGNHICTKDLTGSNNPNYGNRKLSERYKNDPELAKKNQGRIGAQNGKAKTIKLLDDITKQEFIFEYIRSAASYLIDNGFTKAKKVDSVLNRLSFCAKTGKKYKNRFCVEVID